MVRVFANGAMGHGIDHSWWNPLSYLFFQPVLHDWCNKCRGMRYPVSGIMHIKELLLLIGVPLSPFEWSFTIRLTAYNRKYIM